MSLKGGSFGFRCQESRLPLYLGLAGRGATIKREPLATHNAEEDPELMTELVTVTK